MAFPRGLITSYDITDNRIHIDDIFNKYQLPETPFLNVVKVGDKIDSTILQWYEDVPIPLEFKLTAKHSVPTSGSGTLDVDDASTLKVGNILKYGQYLFRITNISGNTLTVTALNGDAEIAADSVLTLVSDANPEAASLVDSAVGQRVLRENVTQIFTEYIKISGTQRELKQWVKNYDIWADEVDRKLRKLRVMMERTLLNGVLHKPTNNTEPRLAGGVEYFINQYGISTTGKTLDEANFKAVLEELWKKQASGIQVWMNAKTKEDFFNQLLYAKVIVDRAETRAGMRIQSYVCEYGEFELYTSPHIEAGKIYFVNPANIEIRPLRPFVVEELAKTGDYVQAQIVGEYTFKIQDSGLMAVFTVG